MDAVEFQALAAIGFTSTILVSRGDLPWLNGEVFEHTPFEIGYAVLGDLCSTFTGEILLQNVLVQTLALFICLNVDANRKTLVASKTLSSNAMIVFIPLILVTFGPSTAMPIYAYQLSRDYRRVAPNTYDTVINMPSFTRTFYTLVAVVALLLVTVFAITCIKSPLDPSWSTVFVIIPFVLAALSFFDIMVEKSISAEVNLAEVRAAHYFAMTASAICMFVGLFVHFRSIWLIALKPSTFWLWVTAGKMNSLFVLHYIITVATSYLWLDHHATVAFGPRHPANRASRGTLGFQDLAVMLITGPSLHFGIAAVYRELSLMRQNASKRPMQHRD